MEDDYCDIQEIHNGSKARDCDAASSINGPGASNDAKERRDDVKDAANNAANNAVMYPEGGYFNSALQNEEDYVKVV